MASPGLFVCAFAVLLSTIGHVSAASVDVNGRSIGLVVGDDTWLPRIVMMGRELNNEKGLRVLPIASAGCMQSAADVLRLDHVDVSLLTTDCVAYAEQQGMLPNAVDKLAYLARVEALPIVLVTRKDIKTLTALAGKRIATGPADSAAFATGELVLGGMGLPFKRVAKSGALAVSALEAGDADAALLLGLEQLPASFDTLKFHALGLTAPAALSDVYAPILLEPAQVRGLAGEQSFETISVALTLVTPRKPRSAVQAKRIKLFSQVYFQHQMALGNAPQLSTNIAGWQRHDASATALQALEIPTDTLQQGDGP
jgi:uncharacterized protein